jgi:hypothetical protein
MAYTVVYIQKETVSGTEPWPGKLIDAQDLAHKAVANGAADRVEIRDENGELVFRHPRATRRA